MTSTPQVHALTAKRWLRTVAVVSSDPYLHALDTVLDGMDHDIVFVQGIAHAYTEIKRVMPDLIVVCLSDDDVASCQVLSMLGLDRETAAIPVLTYAPTALHGHECALHTEDSFTRFGPASMN